MADLCDAPDFDVAVVGAGIGGVYTAWRLAEARESNRVVLIESSDRIGGRLLSARPPSMPHTTCEVGGMRYVSTQPLVKNLVEKKLRLHHKEQTVDVPSNLAFLRGRHLRVGDIPHSADLPYNLEPAEAQWLAKNSPGALIGWAINQVLPETRRLTGEPLHRYLRTATVDGVPLYEHGFWNLLARTLSREAYDLAKATIGYDTLGSNANAVDLAGEYFNFAPDVKYYLLKGGYEILPWTLAQQFENAGGELRLDTKLSHFDEVRFADGSTGVRLYLDGGEPVTARAIVLGLPPRSIQLLAQRGPLLDPARAPQFRNLLASVKPISLYKLFMVYEYPWWEARGVSQGRSITDTAVRQCYYWAEESKQPGADPNNTHAAVMAYNDMGSSDFWAGLTHIPVFDEHHRVAGHRRPFESRARVADDNQDEFGKRLVRNWQDHKAPANMVAEMHRQLVRMHDLRYAPEPVDAAYMEWADDPYGGGVHLWNIGYKSWELVETMVQPLPDLPAYICGEAFSTNQTWVEGALQTAELVLQKHLGLPPPEWVSA